MSSAIMLGLVGLALPATALMTNGGRLPALSDVTGRMPLLTVVIAALLGVFWRQEGRPRAVTRHQAPLAFVFAAAITSTLLVPYALMDDAAKVGLGLGLTFALAAASFATGRAAVAVEHRRLSGLALASLALVSSWLVFDSGSAGFAAQFGALAAAAFAGAVLPQGSGHPAVTGQAFARAVVAWFAAYATLLLGSIFFGGLGWLSATALAALPPAGLAAFGRRHRRIAVVASLALLAVGASACGMVPFGKARYEDKTQDGEVRFRLGSETLSLLGGEDPVALRIRVFTVVEDELGEQEGPDHDFKIAKDTDTYSLTGVRLGMKEFQVAILNGNGEVIGDGKVRIVVKPGAQTLDTPLTIKLRPAERRRRDVALALFARIAVPDQPTKLTYLDLKPVIEKSCATGGCHLAAPGGTLAGGLDLATFPFTSLTHPERTQDEIMNEMLLAMRDLQYTMPPPTVAPPLPEATIARFDQWRADGLLRVPPADQTDDLARKIRVAWSIEGTSEKGTVTLDRTDGAVQFPGTLLKLPITMKCDLKLTVVAADGKDVVTIEMNDWLVTESGGIEKILDIPYADPQIDIPIVITH